MLASSNNYKLYMICHLSMLASMIGTEDHFIHGTEDPGLSGVRINSLVVNRNATVFETSGLLAQWNSSELHEVRHYTGFYYGR